MTQPKNVLVLGGAGYLGSVMTRQLLDNGHRVRVLDRFSFTRESLADLQDDEALEVIEGDIRDISHTTECMDDMDAVILLASVVGEPACDIDPKVTADTNLLATTVVAEACAYYGVKRLIFASTDSVYGIREGIMREDSETNAISLYGRLKLQAESRLLSLKNDGFSTTILRMATLYGLSPRMRFDLVVNTLAMRASVEGKIKIFGGKQWRPFVHVADAAGAYLAVLEAPTESVADQIFNVGSNDQNYMIEQLGDLVRQVFPEVEVETIAQTPDLRDYYVNCDKIRKMTSYDSKRSIVDGLQEIKTAIESGAIKDIKESRYYNV